MQEDYICNDYLPERKELFLHLLQFSIEQIQPEYERHNLSVELNQKSKTNLIKCNNQDATLPFFNKNISLKSSG